jgi:hypothetical protein
MEIKALFARIVHLSDQKLGSVRAFGVLYTRNEVRPIGYYIVRREEVPLIGSTIRMKPKELLNRLQNSAELLIGTAVCTLKLMILRHRVKSLAPTSGSYGRTCTSLCRQQNSDRHIHCLAGLLRQVFEMRGIMPPSLLSREELWKDMCPLLFESMTQVGPQSMGKRCVCVCVCAGITPLVAIIKVIKLFKYIYFIMCIIIIIWLFF